MNRLRRYLKLLTHRKGWVASPSLSFMGEPFGPHKRDLAAEVLAAIASKHDPDSCPVCNSPDV